MIFTHEQTQDLLKNLREYRDWLQKSEYTADEKTPGIMEGIATLEKAETFIADLDAAVTEKADRYMMRWAKAEEMDNFGELPIKRMFFKADENE